MQKRRVRQASGHVFETSTSRRSDLRQPLFGLPRQVRHNSELPLDKHQLARSNQYYNQIHPTEAAEVDTRLAEERAAAAAKAKQAAEAKAAALPTPPTPAAPPSNSGVTQ